MTILDSYQKQTEEIMKESCMNVDLIKHGPFIFSMKYKIYFYFLERNVRRK